MTAAWAALVGGAALLALEFRLAGPAGAWPRLILGLAASLAGCVLAGAMLALSAGGLADMAGCDPTALAGQPWLTAAAAGTLLAAGPLLPVALQDTLDLPPLAAAAWAAAAAVALTGASPSSGAALALLLALGVFAAHWGCRTGGIAAVLGMLGGALAGAAGGLAAWLLAGA